MPRRRSPPSVRCSSGQSGRPRQMRSASVRSAPWCGLRRSSCSRRRPLRCTMFGRLWALRCSCSSAWCSTVRFRQGRRASGCATSSGCAARTISPPSSCTANTPPSAGCSALKRRSGGGFARNLPRHGGPTPARGDGGWQARLYCSSSLPSMQGRRRCSFCVRCLQGPSRSGRSRPPSMRRLGCRRLAAMHPLPCFPLPRAEKSWTPSMNFCTCPKRRERSGRRPLPRSISEMSRLPIPGSRSPS